MEPERWQRIKAILDSIGDAMPEDRYAVLAASCGGDRELQEEVENYLDLEEEAAELLEEPLWTLQSDPAEDTQDLDEGQGRIGPYRIERLLGRGGMGEVFLAVREDDYEQHVAIKLISKGIDREEILARFLNERQILAHLQHPMIARLLDGGTTDDGRPYFVMEYVEGQPIDKYCEANALGLRARLRLFTQVCSAVQYAHQNLVVHRDLKAGNILVTDDGYPRLLDFGIAKLLQSELGVDSQQTQGGQAPMTPAYASPEQILNDPITTACDVYALGILLYRLLTGSPPYVLEGRSYAEIVKVICLRDPPKPSEIVVKAQPSKATDDTLFTLETLEDTRPIPLQTARPPSPPKQLRRKLTGDLDAIVLKALRKEPKHRYGSASALAGDIKHHLRGLPVKARQGNWLYYTVKFIRRNSVALGVVLLIAGSAVSSTVLWRQAEAERDVARAAQRLAEREQERANQVKEFLEGIFDAADPNHAKDGLIPVAQLLEKSEQEARQGDLELQAEMLGSLGTLYQKLGMYQKARSVKEDALRKRRAADPSPRPDLAKDLNNLGSLFNAVGDFATAEIFFQEALEMRHQLGQDLAQTLNLRFNLANTLVQLRDFEDAEALYREIIDYNRTHAVETSAKGRVFYSLAVLHMERGNFEESIRLLQETLELRIEKYGKRHTKVASVLGSLGKAYYRTGDIEGARETQETELDIKRELLGDAHPKVAKAKKRLARTLLELGDTALAGRLLEEALSVFSQTPKENKIHLAEIRSLQGTQLLLTGHPEEAAQALETGYQVLFEELGPMDSKTREALARLQTSKDSPSANTSL